MVSYSRDGGLAATGLQTLGYEVVRGSSSRGGGEGLLMLRGHLASGSSVVMAVDGPQAPLGDVKAGGVYWFDLDKERNLSTWFSGVLFFLFGCCWGSFLNVCIYRLPAMRSVVWPGSRDRPSCGAACPARTARRPISAGRSCA